MKKHNLLFYALAIVFFFGLMIPLQTDAQVNEAISGGQLSLSKVVLFKNGVGYFELKGSVPAGNGVKLYFKRDQMNDLLKSLTVINLSGGQVSSTVYDSTKTAAQQLSDYSFDLKKGQGLPQVMKQLQGSRIELMTGSTSITGTVIGVERRISRKDETEIPLFYLSIIDSDGRLRGFNIDEITAVKFLDPGLDEEIRKYLSILFDKHLKNKKTVVITPTGEGLQELLVSYVTEAPVWKATYRIIIPEGDKGAKPFLQGWAIVDNVSGEDWKKVELCLVSGLPISFVQNLYDPYFKKRPLIKIEKEAPVTPPSPEAGVRMERMMKAAPMAAAKPRRMESFGAKEDMENKRLRKVNLEDRMRELKAEAVTREVGDLFEYRIDRPVTIGSDRSALVPIVAKEVEGRAVDLYNEKTRANNPLAAVRLKNSTGLTLEGGPVTVIRGGNYAGEALIKTVKPDEELYVAYAVDLGLHVNTRRGTKTEEVDHVVINRGVIRMHRAVIETKAYNLDNKKARTKTVIIEHPFHPDWRLLDTEKPIEITDNYLRFEVKAPGLKNTEFTVREMRDVWERIMVSNLTPEQIVLFSQRKYLSETSRKRLEKIVALKAEIVAINRDIRSLKKERNRIFKDQNRLRANLKGLGQTAEEKGLRSRYVKQLDQQETRLEGMEGRQRGLAGQLKTKEELLDKMIEALAQDLKV